MEAAGVGTGVQAIDKKNLFLLPAPILLQLLNKWFNMSKECL